MRLSTYFLPTLREDPAEAIAISHRLMLRAGMVRQASAGIYTWLPLGLRVLHKIEKIVREEQERAGAQELLMPTIQSADLWRESNRYDDYGEEMLRIKDRHGREMLYGPTNEEMIVAVTRNEIRSYRDLPKNLFHIQWKFRDEIRPRFGIMRAREFLMKDNYSFDFDEEGAKVSYNKMFVAYLRTFARLGLKSIPVMADTGPIGGESSHEFMVLAPTGESEVFADARLLDLDILEEDVDYSQDLSGLVAKWTDKYAASDEAHDEERFHAAVPHNQRLQARGIEVGQVFSFGTKYSEPMGATVVGPDGEETPMVMGSYGIGVSRLVAALIEVNHDDDGIIWPKMVAPFAVGLINVSANSDDATKASDAIYGQLTDAGIETLYDDRDERAGAKFAAMDLIGLPTQVIVGARGIEKAVVELKDRRSGKREEVPVNEILDRLST